MAKRKPAKRKSSSTSPKSTKTTGEITSGSLSTKPDPAREATKRWFSRISQSCRAYDEWTERYQTESLYDFYLGHQVPENLKTGSLWSDPYVLNLIFPTIDSALPSLLFYRPYFKIRPKATRLDDPTSNVDARAKLREDTLNTFIQDNDTGFDDSVPLSIQEAFFRFGVAEVGYTVDFIDNPNAHKPTLLKDGSELKDQDGKPVPQPEKLPKGQQLFIKRIPAKTFRCSVNAKTTLLHNDWVGYYEWHHLQDIKANKSFKNTAELKASGRYRDEYKSGDDEQSKQHDGMVKLWRIWDIRSSKKWTLAEGHDLPLREEDFEFLPLAVYRPHPILDEFLPLPPVYNWIHPQLEYSESRQQQRVHRRRFERRYTYRTGSIEEDQIDKLFQGGDGTTVPASTQDGVSPLVPVPDAPLHGDQWRGLAVTKDDFREISGRGGDQRGSAESQTATQAAIIDSGAKIRDSFAKSGPWGVAKFLTDIARLVLFTIEDKLPLSYWILTNVDPKAEGSFEESQQIAATWREITSEELGDLDYDVAVDVESMAPITEDAERNRWVQLLPILFGNPGMMVAFTQAPELLEHTLRLHNVRDRKMIESVRRAMEFVLKALSGGGAPTGPGGPGGGAGGQGGPNPASPAGLAPAPGPTPSTPEIMNQLGSQLGG